MVKNTKNIVLIITVVAVLSAPVCLFKLRELERSNRLKAEERLWQEKAKENKTEKRLFSLKEESENIKGSLVKIKEEAESLNSELIEHKRSAEALGRRIAELDTDIGLTKDKIEKIVASIAELKERLTNTLRDKSKLAEELAMLEKTTDALKKSLTARDKAKTGERPVHGKPLEPGKSVSGEARELVIEPTLVGEILIVNREFDFVVINLGKDAGLTEGMVFDISRDGKVLGKVEVETVRKNISAATFVDKDIASDIRAGDKTLFYAVR